MSYRIDYKPIYKMRRKEICRARMVTLTCMCFLLFVLLVFSTWKEGADHIKACIYEIKDAVVVSALDTFADNLQSGQTVQRSFTELINALLKEIAFGQH